MKKMPNKAPDDKVRCAQCTMEVQRRNLNRHQRIHMEAAGETSSRDGRTFMCRSITSHASVRSRSSSKDSVQSIAERPLTTNVLSTMHDADADNSDAAWCPSTATVTDAARAVLHQRGAFTEEQLCAYIAHHYPEIPPIGRRYLVIGAVSGAQYASYQHHLWRDNARVADVELRKMASDAASVLSCWTAGFRPNYEKMTNPVNDSAECHELQESEMPSVRTKLPSQKGALSLGNTNFQITDLELPVPLPMSNQELEHALDDLSQLTDDDPMMIQEASSVVGPAAGECDNTSSGVVPCAPSIAVSSSAAAPVAATSTVASTMDMTYDNDTTKDMEYRPTPIVLLKRAEALKQKCLKKKTSGEGSTSASTVAKSSVRLTCDDTSHEQATQGDEVLELHAPGEIDTSSGARERAQIGKPKPGDCPKGIQNKKMSPATRATAGCDNDQGKTADSQRSSTSKDRRPHSPDNRHARSPFRRSQISPVDRRRRSPEGLYRLSAEEYAVIEKRRRERSPHYKPTYRRT